MFNGTPVIEQISPTEARITGITLPSTFSGTIGFSQSTESPNIFLPDELLAPITSFLGEDVSLASLVKVSITPISSGPFTNLPPSVAKSGETPEDFVIKVTNTNTSLETQELEIYVVLLGQAQTSSGIVVNVIDSAGATVNITPEC